MKILLVDDDADWRRTTAILLQELGHDVFEAVNAADAALVIATALMDVLITDIRLPDSHGDVFAAEARERQPGLRLVFVTGDAAFPDPEADPHGPFLLKKPMDLADLEAAINSAR